MPLFSGISNLFSGVRSIFGGTSAKPLPTQEELFSGDPGAFGDRAMIAPGQAAPTFLLGSDRPLQGPDGDKLPPASTSGLMHTYTFASLWNSTAKTYSWRWDEAYRRSREDAVAMRRDCFLMALLFERKYPTAQMPWHIEPDDKKNTKQMAVADYIKSCVDTLPNVPEMLMLGLEDLWYGRSGIQMLWTQKTVKGMTSLVVESVVPVNGDKIQFSWDGTPQIRLYGGTARESEREVLLRRAQEEFGVQKEDTIWTDRGLMLLLKRPYWRDRFQIWKHDIIDADFYESDMAGGVHGVGIRHWIYWFDWIKKEIASYIMDFLERTGQGFTVYYYDPGNPQDLNNVKQIAKQQGRNTWIVWPRAPGSEGAQKGVERIEPNVSGTQVLKDLLAYYDSYIERFIIGQSMSGGADNESGLGGSGRAKFARQCVPVEGSEILTRDGFKAPEVVEIGEEVLAYDPAEDVCKWTPMLAKTFYDDADVSKMHHKAWEAICTPDHSWAVEKTNAVGQCRDVGNRQTVPGPRGGRLGKRRTRFLRKAKELTKNDKIILAAPEVSEHDSILTPTEAAVLGWVVTDGTIRKSGGKGTIPGDRRRSDPGFILVIYQSKEKNFEAIRMLAPCGAETVSKPFQRNFPTGKTYECLPQHAWSFGREASTDLIRKCNYTGKHSLPRIVTRLSRTARAAMLDAMMRAEATAEGRFSNQHPALLEAFDVLCALQGIATGKLRREKTAIGKIIFHKAAKKTRYVTGQRMELQEAGVARVWCPTTEYGTWIMRQNGRVMITGNTKTYIIRHDCLKSQGHLSRDFVRVLMRLNRANCERIYGGPLDFECRWKFDIEVDDPEAKLKAGETLAKLGVKLKADELRSAGGFEKPADDDEVVGGQPVPPGQGGALFGGQTNGQPGGKPEVFQGAAAAGSNGHAPSAPEKEEEREKAIRYAGKKNMKLSLYVYRNDDEIAAKPLGEHDRWELFARWASSQGKELERLGMLGHTDEFCGQESLQRLAKQLEEAEVPEVSQDAANTILDVIRGNPDAEGLVVSEEEADV